LFIVEEKDPMTAFRYGLRAPDTKRQYPRRFQYFLNFLQFSGTLDEQAKQFTLKARESPNWAQESHVFYRLSKRKGQKRRDIGINDYQLLRSNQVILCHE
jgi:hypothetical protein